MFKRIVCLLVVFCIFSLALCFFSVSSDGRLDLSNVVLNLISEKAVADINYTEAPYTFYKSENSKVFTNYYDGYIYSFTDELTPNCDNFSNRVRFENNDMYIDIFHETCEFNEYVNYTNKAILENTELNVTTNIRLQISGKLVNCIAWSRPVLSRVKNDKNFYVKYDIKSGNSVYTLFIKTTSPLSDPMRYFNGLSISTRKIFDPDYINSLDKRLVPTSRKWNEETVSFYNLYFSEFSQTKWGIFSPEYIWGGYNLQWYEEAVDYKFPVVLHYTGIKENYDSSVDAFLRKSYNDGRYVELTIQPPLNSDRENMLFDVLDGKYDDFLFKYAEEVKKFSHPVMLRLFNEMNGDWCEYSSYQMSADTDLYIALYRYVADFFKDAQNVIFIWNPNGKSFPDFKWNDAFLHYPGNDYVDVLGLTAYNTGTYYKGETWIGFEELYDDIYKKYSAITDMPLMVTEFACARQGGYKEGWTRDMFSKIIKYPRIKIFVWWNAADFDTNGNVSRAYYINDSDEMVEIFKSNLKWY